MGMRLIVWAVVLALVASAEARVPKGTALPSDYTYEQYLEDSGMGAQRRDETAEALMLRRSIFMKNLKAIRDGNAANKHFTLGINAFVDWTDAELTAGGVLPSESMQQILKQATSSFGVPKPRPVVSRNITRKAFDWRDAMPPVLTTIKNQGLCGSCWAHATTEAVESRHAIKHGVLNALSQQQLVSCVPNVTYTAHMGNRSVEGWFGGCGGYFANMALSWLMSDKKFGPGNFVSLWENPYESFFVPEKGSPNVFNITGGPPKAAVPKCASWMAKLPPTAVVSGYKLLPTNDAEAFEHALINHGPIVAIISLACRELAFYEGGIFSCPPCEGGTFQPSHVVNIVGFGEDAATKQSYWVVRNSWGGNWGEGGYIRLARGWKNEYCGTMIMPDNVNNINGTWGFLPSCGMCGVITYGLVPDVV